MSPILLLTIPATVFFVAMWISGLLGERKKTNIEKKREQIAFDAAKAQKGTFRDRLVKFADTYGWDGGLLIPLLALGFGYLAVAASLTLFGFNSILAAGIALPVSVGVLLGTTRALRARRKREFNRQLVNALELFATQLKAGSGPKRALSLIVTSLPEPLKSEMAWVSSQSDTQRSLGDSMADLASRYPSKAMRHLVAAIRIDEEKGASIAPALESAAASVRTEMELSQEAESELAETRYEFYGILGIMAFIVWVMVGNAEDSTREAFFSPIGVMLLSAATANFALGIWRVLRILNNARGDA